MENRNWESGAAGSPPSAPASPSNGYPTAGNPGGGIPPTKPGPFWFHQVGEEIRSVITAAGLTPDDEDLTQLQQAIQQLIITAGAIKTPVRVGTTANIASLAGGAPNTLDGINLAVDDRVLVKDQGTGAQNGIYVVTTLGTGADGTWTRATDADGVGELVAGMLVVVQEGTANADTIWELSTDGAITIGTTALTFTKKGTDFASDAEAQALTILTKAISPGTLKTAFQGANQSLAASGYQKLPGGLIIQWGTVAHGTGTGGISVSGTFPIAFPNAAFSVHGTNIVNPVDALFLAGATLTPTGFTGTLYDYTGGAITTGTLHYLAIGH